MNNSIVFKFLNIIFWELLLLMCTKTGFQVVWRHWLIKVHGSFLNTAKVLFFFCLKSSPLLLYRLFVAKVMIRLMTEFLSLQNHTWIPMNMFSPRTSKTNLIGVWLRYEKLLLKFYSFNDTSIIRKTSKQIQMTISIGCVEVPTKQCLDFTVICESFADFISRGCGANCYIENKTGKQHNYEHWLCLCVWLYDAQVTCCFYSNMRCILAIIIIINTQSSS